MEEGRGLVEERPTAASGTGHSFYGNGWRRSIVLAADRRWASKMRRGACPGGLRSGHGGRSVRGRMGGQCAGGERCGGLWGGAAGPP